MFVDAKVFRITAKGLGFVTTQEFERHTEAIPCYPKTRLGDMADFCPVLSIGCKAEANGSRTHPWCVKRRTPVLKTGPCTGRV
jgi:hypothetical protein